MFAALFRRPRRFNVDDEQICCSSSSCETLLFLLCVSISHFSDSGLEQEPGSLVIGVTAITFLNLNDQICYVHPYQILSRYLKSEAGFEYSLDAKHKGARYVFQVAADQNVDEIVTEIDKRSLRLEKSLAAGKAVPSASPLKSPRGGGGSDAPKSPRGGAKSPRGGPEPSVPVFDPDVVPISNPKPTQKVGNISFLLWL